MAITRNNYVFKGHKTLLGSKFVTYGEVELPTRYELFAQSKSGFDWGYAGSAAKQLAFSMLYQVCDEEFARENAVDFAFEVIRLLSNRDWVMNASEVLAWASKRGYNLIKHTQEKSVQKVQPQKLHLSKQRKVKKTKTNVVKEICKELQITQKNLAEILEVPEGTVSSWAVKNEIPRLGKKAIEFYIANQKNQQIVDSYQNFLTLMQSA